MPTAAPAAKPLSPDFKSRKCYVPHCAIPPVESCNGYLYGCLEHAIAWHQKHHWQPITAGHPLIDALRPYHARSSVLNVDVVCDFTNEWGQVFQPHPAGAPGHPLTHRFRFEDYHRFPGNMFQFAADLLNGCPTPLLSRPIPLDPPTAPPPLPEPAPQAEPPALPLPPAPAQLGQTAFW